MQTDPLGDSGPDTQTEEFPDAVDAGAAVFEGLGDGFDGAADRLRGLGDRLRSLEFRVAVVGQFKRGKSTLLNALLGEEVLPSAVLPLTSVPTLLRHAPSRRIEVLFADGHPPVRAEFADAPSLRGALADYVTEKGNPENRRGVERVVVGHPAPVLANGLSLVDTPGIGSTHRHNTETTLAFLPECDAALFVVSPDPPLTEVEIEFLRSVKPEAVRLHVILNKVDTVGPEDRDELVRFVAGALAREAGLADAEIPAVSAQRALAARGRADDREWRRSGLAGIEERILGDLSRDKTRLLSLAVRTKALHVLEEGDARAGLAAKALRMPLEELDRRLVRLRERVAAIRDEARVVLDVAGSERERALAFLEERSAALRERARARLKETLERALQESGKVDGVRQALAGVVSEFFDAEAARMAEEIRDRLTEALRPHQDRAGRLLRDIGEAAREIFDVEIRLPESGEAFRLTKDIAWSTEEYLVSLTPIPAEWIDAILPRRVRSARVRRRLRHEAEWLVVRNVENLRWACHRSIRASVPEFLGQVRGRLEELAAGVEGAVARARRRHEEGAEAVCAEARRLDEARTRLASLRGILRPPGSPDRPE